MSQMDIVDEIDRLIDTVHELGIISNSFSLTMLISGALESLNKKIKKDSSIE